MQIRQEDIFIINSDERDPIIYGDDLNLYTNREKTAESITGDNEPLVSIYLQAYNHLEDYTKPAVEAIFKYTEGIDYELILVDNGSSDGTFEYFKSLRYPRKRVYRITKNIGAFYGYLAAKEATRGHFIRGKYFVSVPNDVLVTKNWLKNMLICAESDERIGFLVPMSDNVTNLQDVDLGYTDFVDMQEKAAAFNISDPLKWYDRLRLIPTACMIRASLRDFYEADYAFVYNFADDDLSFAYRRLGYRLILCGDVFVHHKGSTVVGVNQDKYAEDIEKGRKIFSCKYNGIDAWDDVVNFERPMMEVMFAKIDRQTSSKRALGIDVRCGTPLFEIKNVLRRNGILDVRLTAYTTEAKYWQDLSFVCGGDVYCGDMDRMSKKLGGKKYDYIVIGEYLDTYDNATALIQDAAEHLTENGVLGFKLRSYDVANNVHAVADALGKGAHRLPQQPENILPELEKLPYQTAVYPYMTAESLALKEAFFAELKSMEEYQQNARIREIYSEDRFDEFMMRYVVVLRKNL